MRSEILEEVKLDLAERPTAASATSCEEKEVQTDESSILGLAVQTDPTRAPPGTTVVKFEGESDPEPEPKNEPVTPDKVPETPPPLAATNNTGTLNTGEEREGAFPSRTLTFQDRELIKSCIEGIRNLTFIINELTGGTATTEQTRIVRDKH